MCFKRQTIIKSRFNVCIYIYFTTSPWKRINCDGCRHYELLFMFTYSGVFLAVTHTGGCLSVFNSHKQNLTKCTLPIELCFCRHKKYNYKNSIVKIHDLIELQFISFVLIMNIILKFIDITLQCITHNEIQNVIIATI